MVNIMTPGTVRMTIPDLLKSKGWTTQEFAKRAGLTYNQALAMKRSVYTRIDLATLAKVADALGVQPGQLFEYQEADR
jgi:transcriptional regulator with XRE-family HTH domain